ncbi:MAG: hypothetical protein E6929_09240 [Clostridium sp.]|nr:hypothetical protein [Clostridium sp.]
MLTKKSYNRFFIILQEDQKGYGIDVNKTPSGYAKLESMNDKGKASFYVQNLKKQKGPYYMILIVQGKREKELINLGAINIDDCGKADISNEYSASNIANTNIGMDKVLGAAICKITGEKVNSIMVGFACGEELKDWINYKIAPTESKKMKMPDLETKKIKQETKDKSEMKRGQENETEVLDNNEPIEKSNVNEKDFKIEKVNEELDIKRQEIEKEKETLARLRQEIDNMRLEVNKEKEELEDEKNKIINDKEILDKEIEQFKEERSKECKKSIDEIENLRSDIENTEIYEEDSSINTVSEALKNSKTFDEYEEEIERYKDYRKKHEKEKKDKNNQCKCKTYPKEKKEDFFKGIVKDLDSIGNKKNIKNCTWHKAKVDKLESMYCINDYNKYSVIYYPMICYYPYIIKHGYFMVGYKYSDDKKLKYIIYAIPGTKNLQDQPYEGKTGFVTFMPDDNEENIGYWLMYFDIDKNSVVVPVKRS